MTDTPMHLPQALKVPGQWVGRLLATSSIIRDLALLGAAAGAVYGGLVVYKRLDKMARTQEILVTDMRLRNEQSAILGIVEKKLPKASPDAQARIAFEIYDGCRRHNYPAYVVMGIIDTESRWTIEAHGGDAWGLMQVRACYAMAHFKAMGIGFSLDALKDPVMNVRIGMRILFDCQDAAVLTGKSPVGQQLRGLYDYNGGGEAYARRVMQASVPYQKDLEEPLKGQLKDLPKVKEPEVLS